jgi:hypothetical protein
LLSRTDPGASRGVQKRVTGFQTFVALAVCVAIGGGTGCAYVEYRRTYQLSVSVSRANRESLSGALDRFFTQRGLVLKLKYRDLYPRNELVSEFEIPRTPDEDRRYPQLLVSTTDTGILRFVQSEYYFEAKSQPQDLVGRVKPQLLETIAATVGGQPDLVPVPRDSDRSSP